VLRFVASRLLSMVLSLWVAMTLIWLAVTQLPGDPVRALFGFTPPPPELYASLRRRFGLDLPVWEQYAQYLGRLLTGDLGNSYPLDPFGRARVGPAVSDTLAGAVPISARLVLGAVLMQVVIGVVAGALSARRADRRRGGLLYLLALLLVSTPVLVAAYVLRLVVAQEAGLLPVSGLRGGWTAFVLPTLSLGALSTGYVVLLTRGEVAETLASPYLKAARGRGFGTARLLAVHALRPSLIPVVAFVAANTGQLVVGLIIVEGLYGLPGVGGTVFQAIRDQDRSLLIGLVTLVMAVVLVANALADVLAAVLDPRLRAEPARR
jgi:oligopeptide transport system permease protein